MRHLPLSPSAAARSGPLMVAAALTAMLAGCGAPPETAETAVLNTDPGRAAFETVPLPGGSTVGADPLALAQTLYGSSEPVEGNYSETPELLSEAADQQVVLFTQVGLSDDSVRGLRHRLEFVPQGENWQLTWAGRQVQCWPGRGHEDWGTAPCS